MLKKKLRLEKNTTLVTAPRNGLTDMVPTIPHNPGLLLTSAVLVALVEKFEKQPGTPTGFL